MRIRQDGDERIVRKVAGAEHKSTPILWRNVTPDNEQLTTEHRQLPLFVVRGSWIVVMIQEAKALGEGRRPPFGQLSVFWRRSQICKRHFVRPYIRWSRMQVSVWGCRCGFGVRNETQPLVVGFDTTTKYGIMWVLEIREAAVSRLFLFPLLILTPSPSTTNSTVPRSSVRKSVTPDRVANKSAEGAHLEERGRVTSDITCGPLTSSLCS